MDEKWERVINALPPMQQAEARFHLRINLMIKELDQFINTQILPKILEKQDALETIQGENPHGD